MPGTTQGSTPNTVGDEVRVIKNIAKLDVYIVNYADGDARDQTRLVFTDPSRKGATWVLRQAVQGTSTLVPASGWFENALKGTIEHEAGADANMKSV